MTTVTQGSSLSQIATDPLRNFKFRVVLNPPGSTSTAAAPAIGFMSVSGLNVTVDVIAYREGGYNPTALPLDTPILTVEGWKPNREMEVGDRVIDPYGQESKVVDLFPVSEKETYTVTLGDGTSVDACYGHWWEVNTRKYSGKWETRRVTTLQLKDMVAEKGRKVYVPKMRPFQYDAIAELPVDPYLLGLLLAEGSLEAESTTFAQDIQNTEVLDRVRAALPEGHSLRSYCVDGNGWKHRITVGNDGPGARNMRIGRNKIHAAIYGLGLAGHRAWEKFIPEMYKRASIEDRLDLLRGFMDGDGSIQVKDNFSNSPANVRFSTSSPQLARDIQEMVTSLGGRCRIGHRTNRTYVYKGERRKSRDEYWINGMPEIDFNPFWMPAKADKWHPAKREMRMMRQIVSVEHAGLQEVRCLEVSAPSHLFIAFPTIPVGNTQKLPGQADFSPITLSKGVAFGNTYDIDWLRQIFTAIQGTGTAASGSDFRYTVDIQVLDFPNETTSAIVKAWFRVYKAWPTSIAWSDLDAGANQLFISQLSLAHEGFDFTLATGAGSAQANNPQTGTA